MTRPRRLGRTAALVPVLAAGCALLGTAGVAHAESVPFTDPSASGYIGFCDRSGNPITSGSIDEAPFVWTAVSSTAAPSGFAKGKATLAAYQPRQGVPAEEWSGDQLTASSTFSNAQHPMAQATNDDEPLVSFLGAYPAQWDGLVQLRLFYSAVDQPDYTSPYPATVIKVSGSKWKVVQGGAAQCHAGTAVSAESQELAPSALATPQAVIANGKTTEPSIAPSSSSSTSASPGSSSARAASSSSTSSDSGLVIGLVVGAVVLIGGGGLYYRRRASGPPKTN